MKSSLAVLVLATAFCLAGRTAALAQTCTYSLSASNQTFNSTGGHGTIHVATSNDCPWTAVSNVPWIIVTGGASGTGTGTVAFTVAFNSAATDRTGTLTIANQTNSVSQTGSRARIFPVKLTGLMTLADSSDQIVRIRLGKADIVEDLSNQLALELDPEAHTLRLIELDNAQNEVNELAISERCVILPGNVFAGDLIFDILPVFNEATGVGFEGDGALQVRGKFTIGKDGLPARVTAKLIGVLNDPVNGIGTGPAAIFKGDLKSSGASFAP